MSEEGESDMYGSEISFGEEGEFEYEEGESEYSQPISDSEEAPQLVPITTTKEDPIVSDNQEDSEVDEKSESSSYDTDELEELQELNDDNHGFVYARNLDTYRMSKKERNEMDKELEYDEHREKFKKKRDEKKGGTTNQEKLKNKPMSMMLPKKVREIHEKRDAKKEKINKFRQLGHFSKNTSQKLESKKRGRQ